MTTARVTWDGQVVPGLEVVGPVQTSTTPIEFRDGSSGRTISLPGRWVSSPVTFRRPVDGDLTLDTWARNPVLRKEITLQLVDGAGTVVVTYRLHGCWVMAYAVVPAGDAGAATEQVTVSVDGWERVTPPVSVVADLLGRERGVKVRRVDLAAILSPHLEETEKNLEHVLAEAEAADAVLVLDEADALLARRTEVADAHDRYADANVQFLLDRLAAHRGPVLVDRGDDAGEGGGEADPPP